MERRLGATLQRMELAELVQADAEATPTLAPTSSSNSLLVGEEWRQRNGSVQWRRPRGGEEEGEEGSSGSNGLFDGPVSPLEAIGAASSEEPSDKDQGTSGSGQQAREFSVNGSTNSSTNGSINGSVPRSLPNSVASVPGSTNGSTTASVPASAHSSTTASTSGTVHSSTSGSMSGSSNASLPGSLVPSGPAPRVSSPASSLHRAAPGSAVDKSVASPSAMPTSPSAMPTSTKRGGFNPLTRFTGLARRPKPAASAMPSSTSAMPSVPYEDFAAGESSATPSPADFPPSDSDSVLYHAIPAGSDDDETPHPIGSPESPIPAELTGKSAQNRRSPRDLLPRSVETGETVETGDDETPALPAVFSEEFSVRFQKLPNESENRDKSKGVSMSTRLKNAWNRILEEDGEDDKKKKKRREKKAGIPAKPAEAGSGNSGNGASGENAAAGSVGSVGSGDLQANGGKKGKWEIETS